MRRLGDSKTEIDKLIIFELRINALNAPVVFLQMIWIMNVVPQSNNYWVMSFSLALEAAAYFSINHRIFGGLVIAVMR